MVPFFCVFLVLVSCDSLDRNLEGTSWSMAASITAPTLQFSEGIISFENGTVWGTYQVLDEDRMRVRWTNARNGQQFDQIVSVSFAGPRMLWYTGEGIDRSQLFEFWSR